MTDEQINKAIAKAVGWESETSGPSWYEYETKRPNYCGCLNAMHEAIETISVGEKSTYIIHLMDICREHPIGCVPDWTRDKQSLARLVQATARQRAKAFLKTLNLYIE